MVVRVIVVVIIIAVVVAMTLLPDRSGLAPAPPEPTGMPAPSLPSVHH